LIFFVTSLHQGKKVKALYSERNLRFKLLALFQSKDLPNERLKISEKKQIKIHHTNRIIIKIHRWIENEI